MPDPNAIEIIGRFDQLKADRGNWEAHWQDIAHFCIPRSKNFLSVQTSGEKFPDDVYDSTARDSLNILAGGLMGGLVNRVTKWFDLRIQDDKVNDEPGVRQWLGDVRDKMLHVLNSSNFYQQIHEFFLDFGGFGTANFYSEPDPIDKIRYYARNVREIFFTEDARGRPHIVYRDFELTAEQARLKFGKGASETIDKAIEEKDFQKKIKLIHCVGPRSERDVSKEDTPNMPFFSLWVEKSEKKIIRRSGYRDFPFNIARFSKNTHEPYGYSPAMDKLPEIKMVNEIKLTMIRAATKMVDPPMDVPHDNYLMPLDFNPRRINYKIRGSADEKINPILTKGDIPVGLEMLNEERIAIKKAFFVDLFITLADKRNMTATEVIERIEEKMIILGPAIGRVMTELLDPVINRTFLILFELGEFGEVPAALEGQDFTIEYVSRLAKAQKASESGTLREFLLILRAAGDVRPDVFDKIDFDRMVDLLADIMGVDPSLILDDEAVKAIREARAEAQQQAQQMAILREAAAAGKDVAQAQASAKSGEIKAA